MSSKIISIKEVCELTRLSRATIYRRMAQSDFPQKVTLGGRAVGWVEAEVIEWIEKCKAARGTNNEKS